MSTSRAAVAIGSFDGVHRGHQAVLAALGGHAREEGLVPWVVTFEPLPREYFAGPAAPSRIQGLRDKVVVLRATGVPNVRCLRFNAQLAAESAEHFVQRVLVDDLHAARVVVGEDFRFGHGRRGDVALLSALGGQAGFDIDAAPTVMAAGERISSTRIRALLAGAQLDEAAVLLGRPYRVSGRVRRGEARGREIGFPTANLVPTKRLALADGVYAVEVKRASGERYAGAAHWGRRAWLGGGEHRLEVHILDFAGDLYGQLLHVDFIRFVRADSAFDSLDAMREQIEQDIGLIRGGL